MKKLVLICFFFLPFLSFGQNPPPRTEWDCNRLSFIAENIDIIANSLPEISKQDNFAIVQNAISNLVRYCDRDKKVLQTPFFLNHLVDQYFRYLDWIETENYYWPLYKQSKQRRIFLNKIAENNFRGINPKDINNKFWQQYIPIWLNYYKFCNSLLWINNIIESKNASILDKNFVGKYVNKCKLLANDNLAQETYLLHQILLKSYYSSFDVNSFKYFKAYASQLNELYNIFTIALWDFYYLVNRFIKVTDANTK